MATVAQIRDQLRRDSAAIRLSFSPWFGVSKSLDADQKRQAAQPFGADGKRMSASKKLIDPKAEEWKEVQSIRSQARAYLLDVTLPFPEDGVRLAKADRVGLIVEKLTDYQRQLANAVDALNACRSGLIRDAQAALGDLFNPADYPETFTGMFAMGWDFPNVEPPAYLQQLSPALYAQECERVQARFTQAVELAEQTFAAELSKILDQSVASLTSGKSFKDSAVDNFREFFARFKTLNLGSNAELDATVTELERVIGGIDAADLRKNASLKDRIVSTLAPIGEKLQTLAGDAPRRRVLRQAPPTATRTEPAPADNAPALFANATAATAEEDF